MGGLADMIPGLQAHRTVPTDAAHQFDQEKASRLVFDAVSLLASLYPSGALEWIQTNRPDVFRYLKEATAEMDQTAQVDDKTALVASIERWVKMHRKAFAIYEQRPPVMERQEEIFS